jgi:threonine aldolase
MILSLGPSCSHSNPLQLFYDPSPLGVTLDEIANEASRLLEPITLAGSRVVLHIQTTQQAVDDLLSVIRELAEKKKAGFVQADVLTRSLNGDQYGMQIDRTQ